MIWFTLALFVVSFIVVALLAPKPEFENARAGSLDDVQFPRATENAPVPLVLGRVRIKGPNTLWYGDFDTVRIREKVKTGLFSSKKVTVGYRYFLGLHLGICIGPGVSLRQIYLDQELVWEGDTAGANQTNIGINKPSLFGGFKQGGGWVSNGLFYNGNFNLTPNAYLESQIGAGEVPAYNGMAHIVFNKAEIGEQNSLRPFAFVVESYTNDLNLPENGTVNGGLDINPMEALYQIMTDEWRGLGIEASNIDILSLQQVGAVLHAEGNGCSIAVSNESEGKRVIQEILRQVDGIMFQDPETGQIKVRLIRDDYDVDLLPVLDENDILDVKSFTRTTWEEVRAQVKVMYPQRERDSERVAIAQDMAVVQTIGKLLTNTISFPFVFADQLASDLAARNLAQASVPLFRVTLEVNRNANTLRPGDPFVFSWSKYRIDRLVMRVQRFDLGSLLDGKIVIEAIQDNFAVADTLYAAPETSGWQEVVNEPTDITISRIVEMPVFFQNKMEFPVEFGVPGWIPLAARPGAASQFYQAAAWHPPGPANETIEDAVFDWPEVPYEGSGVLSNEYNKYDGFQNGSDDNVGIVLNSVIGTFINTTEALIRSEYANIIVINDEFMAFETAVDNGNGNWTLTGVHRGIMGTTPATHPIGSRLYSVPVEAIGQGLFESAAQSQQSTFRLMDSASGITQDITEGQELQTGIVFPALNRLGVRPGNLELEGSRDPNQLFLTQTDITLTWARRAQAPLELTLELDPDEVPTGPASERYAVDVYVDDVFNNTLSSAVLPDGTTSYVIPISLTTIDSLNVEARVRAIQNSQNSRGRAIFPFQLLQGPGIIDTQEQFVITFTGFDQDFVVPSGVTIIQFALGGASGGSGDFASGVLSGAGGYIEGELPVNPGDVLRFQVGEGGRGGDNSITGEGGLGGWPDGGDGAYGDAATGGGGGSTRIWLSTNGGVDWVLVAVAGGGGGSGGFVAGGDAGAGGPNGQDAEVDGGTGGKASGAVGFDSNDAANLTKQGVAINETDPTPVRTGGFGSSVGDNVTPTADDGGGGGGGWRGGGGGGGDARSGGGGANFASLLLNQNLSLAGDRNLVTPKMTQNASYPGGSASVGVISIGGPDLSGNDGWAALYYDLPIVGGVGAHRYWRILQEGADNPSFYGIGEIQMFETAGGSDVTDTAFAIAGASRATFGPEEAFDNSVATSNAWSVELAVTNPADRWVGQDFGAGNEKEIEQITLQARGDSFPNQMPSDFRLQFSDDNVVWTDALIITGEASWTSSEVRTYDVTEIPRQYWRVLIEDAQSTTFFGLNELEMRETVGGADVTTTGFAIAGAFNPGDTPQEAFDGNLSTFSAWSVELSATTPDQRWIGQDFGAGNGKVIREIQIRARDSSQVFQAPRDFRLQWSDDNVNWFTKLQVTDEPNWTAGEERQYSETQAHRYWRLRGTVAGTYNGGALAEVVFKDGAGTDITVGGSPFAGSELSGHPVTEAFDKEFVTTRWAGASGSVAAGTSWVAYDFVNPVVVDQFDITSRDSPDQNQMWDEWVLEWSDDGTNWNLQNSYVDTSSWGSAETRNFTA